MNLSLDREHRGCPTDSNDIFNCDIAVTSADSFGYSDTCYLLSPTHQVGDKLWEIRVSAVGRGEIMAIEPYAAARPGSTRQCRGPPGRPRTLTRAILSTAGDDCRHIRVLYGHGSPGRRADLG